MYNRLSETINSSSLPQRSYLSRMKNQRRHGCICWISMDENNALTRTYNKTLRFLHQRHDDIVSEKTLSRTAAALKMHTINTVCLAHRYTYIPGMSSVRLCFLEKTNKNGK